MKKVLVFIGLCLTAVLFITDSVIASGASLAMLPFMGNFNANEFLNDAEKNAMASLSNNFDGGQYEMFGGNDISLDFHGQTSNLIEDAKTNVALRCRVTNNTNKDISIVLFPAYFPYNGVLGLLSKMNAKDNETVKKMLDYYMSVLKEAGVKADAVMFDGTVYLTNEGTGEEVDFKSVECKSLLTDKPIWGFIEFCRLNATRIPEILIASNNIQTYKEVMLIEKVSPARSTGNTPIHLGDYFDQKNNRVDYITVPTHNFGSGGLQFDNQTLVVMNIPARVADVATIVDFTFKLGATANIPAELNRKAEIAKSIAMPAFQMKTIK
jgi:hypothetical protein